MKPRQIFELRQILPLAREKESQTVVALKLSRLTGLTVGAICFSRKVLMDSRLIRLESCVDYGFDGRSEM